MLEGAKSAKFGGTRIISLNIGAKWGEVKKKFFFFFGGGCSSEIMCTSNITGFMMNIGVIVTFDWNEKFCQ